MTQTKHPFILNACHMERGGGGGTPIYGLYGDVPLNRVWNRVYKSAFLSGTEYTLCHSDSGARSG